MMYLLEIESIWEDDDLFEIIVHAANQVFSETAKCYTTRNEIRNFGNLIAGFPKTTDQEVTFSTGSNENTSNFTIHFKCTDKSGHILARVHIAHIEIFSNAPEENYTAEFDLQLEANTIDLFSKSIIRISNSEIGKAKAKIKLRS